MNIVNRIGQYLQQGRNWYTRDVKNITVFSIHHSASRIDGKTDDEILQELMADHTKQGWPGLSYHFVIIRGTIYQINEFSWVTWVDTVNWDCIGICLAGYYHEPYNDQPTEDDLKAFRWLLDQLSTQHPEFPASQGDAYGHRERYATACPGDTFFPYTLEYRSKLGAVTWGNYQALPAPAEQTLPPVETQPATPAAAPTTIEEKQYTQSEYDAVVQEKEAAQQLLQQKINDHVEVSKNYSTFQALGYNTVDDVTKVLNTKDNENRGLIKQITSLKTQLVDAGKLFAENQAEDITAIAMGMKAADELKTLASDHNEMLKALGAKNNNIFHVLSRISNLRDIADKAMSILEKDHVMSQEDVLHVQAKWQTWLGQTAKFLACFTIVGICILYLFVGRG